MPPEGLNESIGDVASVAASCLTSFELVRFEERCRRNAITIDFLINTRVKRYFVPTRECSNCAARQTQTEKHTTQDRASSEIKENANYFFIQNSMRPQMHC